MSLVRWSFHEQSEWNDHVQALGSHNLYEVLKVYPLILDSSMVERTAVNRDVVGSSPTRGVFFLKE